MITTSRADAGRAGSSYPFLTLKERDNETGLDYFEARYYSSTQGRFSGADDSKYSIRTDPQTWNLYEYVRNGPLTRTDPTGRNWFQFQGAWYWFKEKEHTFIDSSGKSQSVKSNFRYLVRFTKTGTNDRGAAKGYLELYDQDKQIARSDVFSGGTDDNGKQLNSIPNGTFFINLRAHTIANEKRDSSVRFGQLNPFSRIQEIPRGIFNGPYETTFEPSWEWGDIRAHLNYPGEGNSDTPDAFKGNYLHGKLRPGDYTHSCICERTELILNALLGISQTEPQTVPVWVRN